MEPSAASSPEAMRPGPLAIAWLQGIELPIGEVRSALNSLTAEGMIASIAAADDSEVVYGVTVAGIERRDAWLRSALSPPFCREELLMRLAVASGPDDIRRLVDLVRSEERARMTEAMERQAVPEKIVMRARNGLPINDWRTRTKFLLHAAELEHSQAELHWLQQVRAVLREPSRHSSHAPGEIRTPDLRFRRPTLYPAELRAQSPLV